MSGNQLRDAWDVLQASPEDAAQRVVDASLARIVQDHLQSALKGLVGWYRPALTPSAKGWSEFEETLRPVMDLRSVLEPRTTPLLVDNVAVLDERGFETVPIAFEEAMRMVRERPHEAISWIDEGMSLPVQHANWARGILAMLEWYKPNLTTVVPGQSAFDDAMQEVVDVLPVLSNVLVGMGDASNAAAITRLAMGAQEPTDGFTGPGPELNGLLVRTYRAYFDDRVSDDAMCEAKMREALETLRTLEANDGALLEGSLSMT